MGYGDPFYAQGRLRHPHVFPDGSAKLLGELSELRFRFGSEWLGAKNANVGAKLFNPSFG